MQTMVSDSTQNVFNTDQVPYQIPRDRSHTNPDQKNMVNIQEKDQVNSPKNIKILIDEDEESKKEDDHHT